MENTTLVLIFDALVSAYFGWKSQDMLKEWRGRLSAFERDFLRSAAVLLSATFGVSFGIAINILFLGG